MSIEKEILEKVRTIGKEMVDVVNQMQGTHEQQYMVAYLVSESELKTGKTCIEHLHSIQTHFRNMVRKELVDLRYQRFGRFIFFMNLYDPDTGLSCKHTEKQFFDPFDTLMHTKDCGQYLCGFLIPMLSDLRNDLGSEGTGYKLLIFTYYIPCTQPEHQCAKLIKIFAEITGCRMTIGYVKNYKSADNEESVKIMKSEKIDIVKLNKLAPNPLFAYPNGQHEDYRVRPWSNFSSPHSGAFPFESYNGYQMPVYNYSPHSGGFLKEPLNGYKLRHEFHDSPQHAGALEYGPNNGHKMPPHTDAFPRVRHTDHQLKSESNLSSHYIGALSNRHHDRSQRRNSNMPYFSPSYTNVSRNKFHDGLRCKEWV